MTLIFLRRGGTSRRDARRPERHRPARPGDDRSRQRAAASARGRQPRRRLAELAELHAVETTRSPAEEADARRDGDTKNAVHLRRSAWSCLRPGETARDQRHCSTGSARPRKATVDRGKDAFKRQRPYIVDTDAEELQAQRRSAVELPQRAYLNGLFDGRGAGAAGARKGRADPGPRGQRYGQSRIVCGQHFRSDVSAGQMLGLLIAERLMAEPGFPDGIRCSSARNWPAPASPRRRAEPDGSGTAISVISGRTGLSLTRNTRRITPPW